MTFDREQTIEQAARAEWAVVWPGIPYAEQAGEFEVGTAAALPVIVRAVTDEIRALHPRPVNQVPNSFRLHICGTDGDYWPCSTVRLCDQIDAQAGVER